VDPKKRLGDKAAANVIFLNGLAHRQQRDALFSI